MKLIKKLQIVTFCTMILLFFNSFSIVADNVVENFEECPCKNNEYYDTSISDSWDYYCSHEDISRRNMETWICDNPDGGDRHNPCWCHLGLHTYFVGKDGIYSFRNIEGITRHTEMCGLGNPGTQDMSICNNFDIWPIDGEPWLPGSWRWYLETSIDGIHWELVSKYPFNRVKESTPFGPTDISNREFRFIRLRMSTDRRGIGLSGYMDNTKFNIDESKVQNIDNEGLRITNIQGKVRAHKYRLMDIDTLLVQFSYDGTTDWDAVYEFSIGDEELKSFDFSLDTPKLARFVRLIPKSGLWNGMPATPGFVDYSTITITHNNGVETLTCEKDTMECSLSPIHPCYSGGQGCNGGSYNECENYMMSGSFHHTYPLLDSHILSTQPNKPDRPSGKTSGKINTEYTYTTSSTDPDGDDIYYMFDWDADGKHYITPWQGPFSSGKSADITHKWKEEGTYNIRVKAKDKYGFQSDWSDPLPVSMPKSKSLTKLDIFYLDFLLKLFPRLQIIFDFN